eukprot:CAMPEP_0182486682 /NCGR_PEP_ID=MMETSP1319-20130603/47516_1 /TAXON_ID=172717 /ORGANISM="Bolidomonas pacifica, Strain RCC208" /LENGTH=776 /DNA_ID=CAMNT_0024688783 /DNA_START=176 /DNA_END=2507 /DNA_ORIENTATION=-
MYLVIPTVIISNTTNNTLKRSFDGSSPTSSVTLLLSASLASQGLCLFMLLALPRGAKVAAKVALKFALSSHASFAAAATGAAVATEMDLYGDGFPYVEAAGGAVFVVATAALLLTVLEENGEDFEREREKEEAKKDSLALASPTDTESLSSPLLPASSPSPATAPAPAQTQTQTQNQNPTRRLLSLAIPHRLYLYLGCLALLTRLPFSLSIPHFVSECLGALSRSDYEAARSNVLLVVVAGTIDACLDFWCVYLFGMAQLNLVKEVRTSLFARLLSFEVSFFDSNPVGGLTSRLNSDTTAMSSDLTWFFRFSIEATVRIGGIIAYMFLRSPPLAGAACAVIPVVALVNKKYGDWLGRNSREVQGALAAANASAQEALACVRTVVAFGREGFESEKYDGLVEKYYRLNVRQTIAQGAYYMLISTFLVNTVVQAVLLYVGCGLVEGGGMEVEVLLAFMLYQGQLQEYTLQIFQSYTALLQSSGAGDKVFSLLDRSVPQPGTGARDRRPSGLSPSASSDRPSGPAAVELRDVTFSYASRPTEQVLRGMRLSIPRGHTVALVGASGCGKTTVVSLLARLYDVAGGEVLFDGEDVRDMDVGLLRSGVALVSQEPDLFSGSIYDNIKYGLSRVGGAEEEEEEDEASVRDLVVSAAKIANAHGFITSFASGYDTLCGEGGSALSGGQKQRIAIARAVVRRPRLLLCDEATAALDNESERAVQQALDRVSAGTTTVVVAHRLRMVRNADKIVVVEKGTVVEEGSHEELVDRPDGRYAEMVKKMN